MSSAVRSKKKAPAKGHKLPEPITEGLVVSDTRKTQWVLGCQLGSGGFGAVYYAADAKKPKEYDYVVKIEYHENGPLFAEMHCLQKIAKPERISEWVKQKKLDYLGLSPCYGFGSFEFNKSKYRFMVLERFDKDLQKFLDENEHTFPVKTVCLLGLAILDVLEYIHAEGYVHGDIKAANLLLGHKKGTQNQVYLVDMGLACKYQRGGVHKPNLPDPKKAHNGTPEFTSRDAHRGSFSRRSDLEILCFNLLQWLTGQLPWEKYISDNNKLQKEKEKLLNDTDEFLDKMFPKKDCPDGIAKFVKYVNNLEFEEDPDYSNCKKMLLKELEKLRCSKNSTLDFKKPAKKTLKKTEEPLLQTSNKENKSKVSKKPAVKRKSDTPLEFEPGTVLTPAMLEILDKRKTGKSKIKKK